MTPVSGLSVAAGLAPTFGTGPVVAFRRSGLVGA